VEEDEVVDVVIGVDGRVEVSPRGMPGMACLAETGDLVRLLGGEVEQQDLTGEAYVDVVADEQEHDRLWR
jgi:Protein of unknown function (DUF2997)